MNSQISTDISNNEHITADGTLKDPFNDRGVSHIGSMLMLTLLNGNSFMVYAQDVVGIEENTPARCLKLFIRDKTSPVLVASNAMELCSVISKLRERENK